MGADGIQSRTRAALLAHTPQLGRNTELPVRLLGVSVIYPPALALKMRALDPFFFQGGDPESDTFMWFSFLDTPSNNPRRDNPDTYECQILVSWPYREGFRDGNEELDVPSTGQERVAIMKELAKGWAEPFQECVMAIPEGTQPQTIKLEDFVPKKEMWNNMQGRCTMVGDAAHAMTMCTFCAPLSASNFCIRDHKADVIQSEAKAPITASLMSLSCCLQFCLSYPQTLRPLNHKSLESLYTKL